MEGNTPTRAIVFLALAAFASQVMVRAADPLLPQIAADVGTTVGTASVVTSAYALSHGLTQLILGPFGDRFPKYAMVTLLCALCAAMVAACGLAQSLTWLGIARLGCGVTAGTIIPLGMAFIGDTVPWERRQTVLGRFISGQILGLVGGQIIGGVIGDHFGWRAVFFVIAAIFLVVALAMLIELLRNPVTRSASHNSPNVSWIAGYADVFSRPWARIVTFAVFAEAAIMFAAFAYIGADLHARQGMSFSAVGLVLAAFGAGGLIYVLSVQALVNRLGQSGLVIWGGAMLCASYLALALVPVWWAAVAAIIVIGLGFHMLHNTLQVNATQMAPDSRATALALFSCALYFGQSAGVALAAPVIDRTGAAPVFIATALLWPLLAFWFVGKLRRRDAV
jgi:MFS transporter, YNFM family, putative membrane transport protein